MLKIFFTFFVFSSFVYSMEKDVFIENNKIKKFSYDDKPITVIRTIMNKIDYDSVAKKDFSSIESIKKTLDQNDSSFLGQLFFYVEACFQSDGNEFIGYLIDRINKGDNIGEREKDPPFDKESICFKKGIKGEVDNISRQNAIKLILDYAYALKKMEKMSAYFMRQKDDFFNSYIIEKDAVFESLRIKDGFTGLNIRGTDTVYHNLRKKQEKLKDPCANRIISINKNLEKTFLFSIDLKIVSQTKACLKVLPSTDSLLSEQDFDIYLRNKNGCLLGLAFSYVASELASKIGKDKDFKIFNDYLFQEEKNSNLTSNTKSIDELVKEINGTGKEKKKQKKKDHKKPKKKKTIKKSPENKENKELDKKVSIVKRQKKITIKDINIGKQSEIIYESFDKPEVSPVSSSNQVNVQSTQVKPQVKKLKKQEMNKKNQNIVKHQEIKKVIKEETEKVQPKNEQLPNKEQIHNLNKKVLHLFIKKKQLEEELDKKKQEKFEQENQQLRTIIKKQKKENFEKYKEISKLKKSNKQKDELIKNYDISLINTNQIHEADRNMLDILARENQKLRQEINNQDLETSIICHLATENALLNQGMIELNKKIDALNKEINEILNSKKS